MYFLVFVFYLFLGNCVTQLTGCKKRTFRKVMGRGVEAGEVQKKYLRKGRLNEQKIHARQLIQKKYSCFGLKKNSYKEFDNEKKFLRLENFPSPPPPRSVPDICDSSSGREGVVCS